MKEDYLWNKTGSDPGVEDLERTLGTLRFKGTKAPRIAPLPESPAPRRFGFRMAFSGAAFASAIVIASFLFLVAPDAFYETGDLSVSLEERPQRITPAAIPEAPEIGEREEAARRIAVASVPKEVRTARAPVKRDPAQSPVPSEDQFAMLTNEEREAYDQLMLALSVTTSSLKLVQEKANGDLYSEPESAVEEIQSRSN